MIGVHIDRLRSTSGMSTIVRLVLDVVPFSDSFAGTVVSASVLIAGLSFAGVRAPLALALSAGRIVLTPLEAAS